MSSESDAFVRQVLHGDPTPIGWADALQYLRQRFGSERGAAKAAGFHHSTLAGWRRKGVTPKPASQDKLTSAVRDLRTRVSKLGDEGVIIHVVSLERNRRDRERDVTGKQLRLAPGTVDAAKTIWVATGDGEAAYRRFLEGIGDPWYRSQLSRGAADATGGGEDSTEDLVDDDYVMESDYGIVMAA